MNGPDGRQVTIRAVGVGAGRRDQAGNRYTGVLPGTDLVVAKSDRSVDIQTIATAPDSPTDYRYVVDLPQGAVMQPLENGAVAFMTRDGGILGGLNPPWAHDANGNPVATSYRVEGTTVVQHVEHQGAAFPVTADPSIDPGWTSMTITLYEEDLRILNTAGAAGITAALIAACTLSAGPVGAAVCSVIAATVVGAAFAIINEYGIREDCEAVFEVTYLRPDKTDADYVCQGTPLPED